MGQSTLPNTNPVVATYTCGHDREHSIPNEGVRLLKFGTGHIAVCDCEGYDLETAGELPHNLGDNTIILSTPDDSPKLWLAFDKIADGWWNANNGEGYDEGVGADDPAPVDVRAECRAEYQEAIEG